MNEPWREPPAAVGAGAAGRVRGELDDDGRLRDLYLDPRVTHLPLDELRHALMTAFADARDQIDERVAAALPPYGRVAPPAQLTAALDEATETAGRQFAEISTALFDLSRRAARPW